MEKTLEFIRLLRQLSLEKKKELYYVTDGLRFIADRHKSA